MSNFSAAPAADKNRSTVLTLLQPEGEAHLYTPGMEKPKEMGLLAHVLGFPE